MSASRRAFAQETRRGGAKCLPLSLGDGRYELGEVLAEGKRALVVLATHRPSGKRVVLKLPVSERRREQTPSRLLRESIALRRARHPGVVEILDSGKDESEQPFVALEHVHGRSLAGLLAARGRFSVSEVLEMGLRLTDILGHVHVSGVVHRDLKPSHVLCVAGGGLKLIDFGSARVPELFETDETEGLTRAGAPLGTPEYMPPEALHGEFDAIGQCDVYALGVLLFELLTGSVPFAGNLSQVLLAQSRGVPQLRALRPEVPTALRTAIERCLAFDLAERYASVADLAVDLEVARDFPAVSVCSRRPPLSVPGHAPESSERISRVSLRPPGFDSRRHRRAPYTSPAVLTSSRGEPFPGRVEEISEGGAQFLSERPLAIGTQGELKFALPLSGVVCAVQVKTHWTRAGRLNLTAAGLEFEALAADAQALVKQYVHWMQGNASASTG
jgi:serine/threonine protein kinase